MENIHDYQFKKNRDILLTTLETAKQTVPYYQRVLTQPSDYYIKDYHTFKEIPLLNKSDIQADIASFLNKNIDINSNMVKLSMTSGSTGVPLKAYKDLNSEMRITKKLWTLRRNWEKDIYKWKLLYLYRNLEDIYRSNVLRLGEKVEYLDLSDSAMQSYCIQIQQEEPQWLIGPPIATSRLANYILENKININTIKYAELYGEVLLPHYKSAIEQAFHCKTINLYGARELNVLSYECPCGAMHPLDDFYFFEIINEKEDNGKMVGELVVTSLTNPVMPLIRYSLGDVCSLEYLDDVCCCNKSKLSLVPIDARTSSVIETGTSIISSGVIDTIFSEFIYHHPFSIKQFQFIQKTINRFEILLIVGKNYTPAMKEELKNKIVSVIGQVKLDVKLVSNIEFDKSLKSKSFIPLDKNRIRNDVTDSVLYK